MALRLIMVLTISVFMLPPAFGQGFMDSILGPGGAGLWGNNTQQSVLDTFNSPQFYGAPMARPGKWVAPGNQNQGGQAQSQPPANYQTPNPPGASNYYYPNVYSSGRGLYPDWYDVGPSGYPTNPGNQQGQSQQEYQTHSTAPEQGQARPANQAPSAAAQRPVQANQAPSAGAQPPVQANQARNANRPDLTNDPERLPPGAVKIITTTPEGTTVQYYTPPGAANQYPPNNRGPAPQPSRTTRPSANNPNPSVPAQAPAVGQQPGTPRIARPTPAPAPGRDPRRAWGSAVNSGSSRNPFSR